MKLSPSQIEQFDRDGYLFFPSLFSAQEVKTLTDGVPALYAQRRPENVREKDGETVRTNFAAHLYSAPFADGPAYRAGLRREAVHAPVQDQRQDGIRRRRLAVAPGFRDLAARRR